MQVILKIENIEAVKRKLEEIENNITDTAPLMSEISNYLYHISKDSFDDEKDPNGHKWTPLANSTLANKRRYGKSSNILWYDGGMQGNLIEESDSDSARVGITTVNEDDYFYPMVHQFGASNAGRNKKTKIPQREFMPITINGELYSDVKDRIEEITVEFIESGLK
ncbi:phage virion morphogenesis protein [Aliarcobacter butzleri]|uniref:phage virion morphogenesis protein n=1 Tax=Aliarcobacter butzleri TaxID=28197 RepID=UPI001EDE6704|nr:phage virion morphogenesis protein [Aliarcobacter butzleri]MCG3698864.1 phage virion morphogenesis protein [Aliarcobacter butzleri]